ncbi:DUF2125 domain-containing protein [Aliiruegeria lutimaris]|uniref:DUF2125 domain-containing protein n=1 Tax=Aliiruegeria lutimaris TaxID=571298 RepID=A0A1G8M6P7_9RHOB|nr:DUF2125 domain-containing protein [Aliiruegeria lutimaris]SDI63629.1 hypothetical protein SAMN04488026_100538 [Aliiruegeria lutimaris]
MKPWILGGVSAAALITIPCVGWSLTAQQAWQSWQDAAQSYGQELTNDGEEMMGGTLTVRGVAMSTDMEGTSISMGVEELVFAEQGDGSVMVTMSETIPVTASGIDPDTGEEIDVSVVIEQSGLAMTASDADGATAFSYDAPSLMVKIADMKIDDAAFPMVLEVALTDTSGAYSVGSGAGTPVESAFEAAGVGINVDVADPEGSGKMVFTASVDGLTTSSFATGFADMDPDDMARMLNEGFAVEGGGKYGPVSFDMAFEEDGSSMLATGSLTGGGVGITMNADGISYEIGYEGLDLKLSGSEIPLPQVTAKADVLSTSFAFPLLVSDAVSPFAFRTAIEGLQVGEEIWSMIDPAAVLPRDPASLILEVAGTGRWMMDIFDEEAMMALDDAQAPGEVETVEVKELKLAIGGAELTGNGAFKLDNTDLQTFDGVPRPEGTANLRLLGGNGLLDKLTQMGLVPQDQVMMVRMMSGMLAKPGSEPDELLSEITIDANGQVLINGAPLPF